MYDVCSVHAVDGVYMIQFSMSPAVFATVQMKPDRPPMFTKKIECETPYDVAKEIHKHMKV